MCTYLVEETGEPGVNHQPWMVDHYIVTCLYPGLNLGRRSDESFFTTVLSMPLILLQDSAVTVENGCRVLSVCR